MNSPPCPISRLLGAAVETRVLFARNTAVERDHGQVVKTVLTLAGAGQLRTRIQAFVESLEIKHIQGGKL